MAQRTGRPLLALAMMLGAALPALAAAQRAAELPAGARVRAYAVGPFEPATGTVVRTSSDTLWVRHDARTDTAAIALAGLRLLERSHGHKRRVGRGAAIGLAVGAAIGAVVGAASAPDPETCSIVCPRPAGAAMIVGVAGGVPGAIIGMIAGARRREVWQRVRVQ